MAPTLLTIALLALGFGLLWLSWKPHNNWVESRCQTGPDQRRYSYRAFWILTEGAGWLMLVCALARCFVFKQ